MCTGPVAVRGAKPGQVLQVDIEAIGLHNDWCDNVIRPLAGALPDDFPENRAINIALDSARMVGRLPWGQEIPLRPFFGVMAVAPPASAVPSLPGAANAGPAIHANRPALSPGLRRVPGVFLPGALARWERLIAPIA